MVMLISSGSRHIGGSRNVTCTRGHTLPRTLAARHRALRKKAPKKPVK